MKCMFLRFTMTMEGQGFIFRWKKMIWVLIHCQTFTYTFLTIFLFKNIYLHLKISFSRSRPFKLWSTTSVEFC